MSCGRPVTATPRDVVYRYDGSLDGFFCAVHESVYGRELPAAILPEWEAQPTLFPEKAIATDRERALRVRRSIPARIAPRALQLIRHVHMSCLAEKELAMLRFLLFGYETGRQAPWMLGHPLVAPLLAAEKHLQGECRLLLGFVRFSDAGGAMTAEITPKNFVLPYIAGHFTRRFSGEDFLIYDKTHGAALIYYKGETHIVPMDGLTLPPVTREEAKYRALWRRFYDAVAIEGRENPRCRMSHMPKRYWENMTELQSLL